MKYNKRDKKTGQILPKIEGDQLEQVKQWVREEKTWEYIRAKMMLDFGVTERTAYRTMERVNKELAS